MVSTADLAREYLSWLDIRWKDTPVVTLCAAHVQVLLQGGAAHCTVPWQSCQGRARSKCTEGEALQPALSASITNKQQQRPAFGVLAAVCLMPAAHVLQVKAQGGGAFVPQSEPGVNDDEELYSDAEDMDRAQ